MAAAIHEIEDSDTRMASADSTVWEDIELAESFLVCCMYEKALSMSSSVLRRVSDPTFPGVVEESELVEIKEAAGMVFVQSLKELGRSRDILKELVQLFGRTTAIPVEVILAGACIQISEAPSGIQSSLEEYLNKWRCVDENHYVLKVEPTSPCYTKNSDGSLALDKYMELVELYAVVLLGKVLNTMDVAISWVEKAEIPKTKREDLLRKLHSLYSHKISNNASLLQRNEQEAQNSSQNGIRVLDGSSEASKTADVSKQSILKLSSRVEHCFWFFRSVTLKFGKIRLDGKEASHFSEEGISGSVAAGIFIPGEPFSCCPGSPCSNTRHLNSKAGAVVDAVSIEAKHLSYSIATNQQGKLLPILKDCSIRIPSGQLWMLLGPNGCGKSTLLKILAGLLRPTTGTVSVRNPKSFVFQNPDHQVVMPTVEADVAFGLGKFNLSEDEVRSRVVQALNAVGMSSYIQRPVQTLSGGQKQRVAIAGALADACKVLLLDELTTFLDEVDQAGVIKAVKNSLQSSEDVTALWVTHRLEELEYADGAIYMEDGNVVMVGDAVSIHDFILARQDSYIKLINS
ncbi:unnamed protein product [Rhodiola kirilowii]